MIASIESIQLAGVNRQLRLLLICRNNTNTIEFA